MPFSDNFDINSGETIANKSYKDTCDAIIATIKNLPVNEFNYYIALLLSSIANEAKPQQHQELLNKSLALAQALSVFYTTPEKKKNLSRIQEAVTELIEASKTQTISYRIKKIILAMCSAVTCVLIGAFGAAVGLSGGFLFNYTIIGNFRGAGLGFLTGTALGAYVGWRIPEVTFMKAFERKLEVCIHHITKVSKELFTRTKDLKQTYLDVEKHIIDTYFAGKNSEEAQAAYKTFLEGDTTFQVCTTTARFIDKSLKGSVGHHALIRYKINGVQAKLTPIELGAPDKAPNFVDQSEAPRTVKGKQLVDMLVLHRILQQTHPYTVDFMRNHYSLGSNDCLTYVNKILIGTGQASTEIKRFKREVDRLPGTFFVSNIVGFFSKTRQNELDSYRKFAYPGEVHPTSTHKWRDREPVWETDNKGKLVQVQWRKWWDDEAQSSSIAPAI